MKSRFKILTFSIFPMMLLMLSRIPGLIDVSELSVVSLSAYVLKLLSFGLRIPTFASFLILCALLVLLFLITNLFLQKISKSKFNYGYAAATATGNVNYITGFADRSDVSDTKGRLKVSAKKEKPIKPIEGMLLLAQGRIVFANKAFFQISGYETKDIFGTDFSQLLKAESIYYYFELIRKNGTQQIEHQLFINSKNGATLSASYQKQKKSDLGSLSLFVVSSVIEKQTIASELSYLMMLENQDSLICQWDDTGVIFLNSKARKLLEIPLTCVITKPWMLFSIARRADRQVLKQCVSGFMSNGNNNQCTFMLNTVQQEVYYRLNLSCFKNNLGKHIYQMLAYDVTNELVQVKTSEEQKQKAEIANQNKTSFLANMSHEIRSPLNGIIGFSELLADQDLEDFERERYISIIHNNGNVLTDLLTDLIDISKLETGNLEIINKPFRLQILIAELETQFTRTIAFKSEHTLVTFDNCRVLNPVTITSDMNRLRQVMVNLLTNAIKFAPNGKVEIGADIIENKILFWVKDNGIGIPHNKQLIIFDRFKQIDKTNNDQVGGFGLGLTISKALVTLLGGNLWVESEPEKGSVFHFTIKTNSINYNNMETTPNNSIYPFDFSGRTILIAEDIDFSFLYIEAVLRRTNIKILWAQNGKDAIELVRANNDISLVLMDIHMPIMNGYDAAKAIKAYRPELTIIAQTAFVLPDDVKKCYAAGCSGYLSKPIRKEHLLNTLADYFEKQEKAANPYSQQAQVSKAL